MSLAMNNPWTSTPAFRCRRSPTAAEWEAIRPQFTELYRLRDHRLTDVMRILEQQHGFQATTKMYKSKITAWGLDKNLKSHDVQRLLRIKKRHEAAGKPCVLLRRGFLVDLAAVERRCRRARFKRLVDMGEQNDRDDNVPDISELQCVAVPTNFSTIDDPDLFGLVQRLLFYTEFGLECFVATQLLSDEDDLWRNDAAFDALQMINFGILHFCQDEFAAGGKYLRHGFTMLSSLFLFRQGSYLLDMDSLLAYFTEWVSVGFGDIVRIVLCYLIQLSETHIPATHPYRTVTRTCLQLVEFWDEVPLYNLHAAVSRSSTRKLLPATHAEVMWSEMVSLAADEVLDPVAYLASVEQRCGIDSPRMIRALDFCVNRAHNLGDWKLVETLLLRYRSQDCPPWMKAAEAVRLAYAEAMLDKHSSSMESLQEALDAMQSHESQIQDLFLELGSTESNALLPWPRSLPPYNDVITQLQAMLQAFDEMVEQWDQTEQQDTANWSFSLPGQ